MRAGDRHHRPDDLVARHARDLAEAPFRNRKRGDASRDAVEIDAQRAGGAGLVARGAFASSSCMPFGSGSNGGRSSALSAIRYGRAARGKLNSNCTLSYTGSNVRSDRKYRYLPVGSNAGP